MRLLSRLAAGTMLGLTAVAVGCGTSGGVKPPPAQPAPASRHSVQTPQLQALMKVIAMTADDYTPRTRPIDVESPTPKADLEKAYAQAGILADALVTAADRIPAAVEDRPLSAETRSGFLAEARTLRRLSVDLKKFASEKKAESMSRSLDQINATCITCHTRYRDLTGTLDATRADAGYYDALPLARTE